MSAETWLEAIDVPAQPTPFDIRAFFGVPPDPEDKLDRNIGKKRRHWNGKIRSRVASEKAKEKVEAALRIISALEQLLKRGVIDEEIDVEKLREQFAGEPETQVGELGDLWRILEELLAAGRLEEALRVANDARARFEGAREANAAFAWLAVLASRQGGTGGDVLRKEGLEAIEAAIEAGERTSDAYTWKAILELDSDAPQSALETLGEAEVALDSPLTVWMLSHRCEAHAALGDSAAALADARRAVTAETDDQALRSNTVTALIVAARNALLPIANSGALEGYQSLIEWAAWFATGVPESEDRVRPYRLWAVEAESRAYTGRIDLRSIIAVASGFLALPVMNRVRSKPHWQVLYEGPAGSSQEVFDAVVKGGIPTIVHDGLLQKLPWFAEAQTAEQNA
jgi:tetratricopeptide (TPR) repeat protein